MSQSQSNRRRLSLVAGSSLVLFGMGTLTAGAVSLAPTSALAYDECAPVTGSGTQSDGPGGAPDPSLNGTTADAFSCVGSFGSVTYTPTGQLTIEVTGSSVNNTTAISGGLSTGPGGNVTININTRGRVSGPTYGVDVNVPGGATTTVNVNNYLDDLNSDRDGRLTGIRAAGAGELVLNNDGLQYDGADFSGLTAAAQVNITENGVWVTHGAQILFGTGDDTLNIAEGGIIFTGQRTSTTAVDATHVLDFGAGDGDQIENAGHFVVNATPWIGFVNQTQFESETRLEGLEVFNHSGVILLGAVHDGESDANQPTLGIFRGDRSDDVAATDGWYDDVLSLPGTRFVGEDGEIWFDVNLNAGPQANCVDRNADGDLAAADCLVLSGGETQGRTFIRINDVFAGDRGAYNPEGMLLVDVSGGTSAAGHFVVSPDSDGYTAANGGVIEKGVFFYALSYNEGTQQHKLVGLPSAGALQLPLLSQAAHGLWRVSTGTWLDRQADLRGGFEEGMGGGVWLRASTELADRDVVHTVEGEGSTFTFDNTFEQTSYAVTGGVDLLSGRGGDSAWVLGVMAGYAHADVEYENSPNIGRFDGWTGGAYASLISGGLFLDAAVNANKLTMDDDVPALNLFPTGTILSTDLLSVGGQVEAGWRIPFAGGAFVEPLAAISYVQTEYDGLNIPSDDPTRQGVDLEFDNPTSLRAGLGGRMGLEQAYGGFRAQYSVLGRLWNEFEGESAVVLHNVGPDAMVMDEFSGTFTEVGLGASLYSDGGRVSGFVNLGGKFGDDYQATTASAGVRVNW